MPGASETKVSAKGRVSLPQSLLDRWGLQAGSRLTFVDLGEATLDRCIWELAHEAGSDAFEQAG